MDGGEKKDVRRPMNAFLIFCKRHRGFVREKNPDMDNRSVTRVLGDLWANLGEEKKIYTNLAKQYKDAFMKANPNYKWHSSDKSQSSSSKVIGKPTNSRVIKNVAEIPTDGSIIPGKLADPEKMGGLSLLLMADKEAGEGRSFSSSLTVTTPVLPVVVAVAPPPSSTAAVPHEPTKVAKLSTSSSALLQLAEMCASELQGSSKDKPQPAHLNLAANMGSTPAFSLMTTASLPPNHHHQPMPPPKKRARHWSLTEGDILNNSCTSYVGSREFICGSLSPQNLSVQKLRCTSLGSTPASNDKFSLVEKYKTTSSRRRLSSSTTESVPSPSGPFLDGIDSADSPVFSPDVTKCDNFTTSEENKFKRRGSFNDGHERFSQFLEMSEKCAGFMPEVVTDNALLIHNQGPVNQKSLQQLISKSGQSPSSVVVSGFPQAAFVQEKDIADMQAQHSPCSGLFVPLYAMPSQDAGSIHGGHTKAENSGLEFYMWREAGKANVKSRSPSCLKPKVLSNPSKCHPSPPLPQKQSGKEQAKSITEQHGLIKSEPPDAKIPSSMHLNAQSISVAPTRIAFTSVLSKDGIASFLGNSTDAVPLQFFDKSHSESTPLRIGVNLSKLSSGTSDEVKTMANRANEQSPVVMKLDSQGLNKSGILHVQDPDKKLLDLGYSASRLSSANQNQIYSERKLKKKWTERMLTEARLKEDLDKQDAEGVTDVSKDVFVKQNYNKNVDSDHDMFHVKAKIEAKPESFSGNKVLDYKSLHHPGDVNVFSGHELRGQCHEQILDHSLDSVNTKVSDSISRSELFSVHSQPKPMQQQSQSQENLKLGQGKTFFTDFRIKSEQDVSNSADTFHQSRFNYQTELQFDEGRKAAVAHGWVKSEEFSNKQVVSEIVSRGKIFVDHIVDQLCRSGYSAEGKQTETEVSRSHKVTDTRCSHSEQPKPGQGRRDILSDHAKDLKGQSVSVKPEKERVLSSSPRKDEQTSCKDVEQIMKDWDHPQNGSEPHSQSSNLSPETCDQQSEIKEDPNIQPLRKSRRANRGQKYQELIKEGFIQPSRERVAARNADGHGRSFGSREEFEKLEVRRTLKRSASERDGQPIVSSAAVSGSCVEGCLEKRFSSGDFDLEKEIESLPVCSLEQLDKKKMMRRRCDSDSLGLSPRHRSSVDTMASASLQLSTSSPQGKLASVVSLEPKIEADAGELCCPAPHILLPKEDRPMEPVTGSRKRKARKHIITRISVVDEKTSKPAASDKKCDGQQHPAPHKKSSCVPGEASCSEVVIQAQKSALTEFNVENSFILDGSDNQVLAKNSVMAGTNISFYSSKTDVNNSQSLTGYSVPEGTNSVSLSRKSDCSSRQCLTTVTVSDGARITTSGTVSDGARITTSGTVPEGSRITTSGTVSEGSRITTSGTVSGGSRITTSGTVSEGPRITTSGTVSEGPRITSSDSKSDLSSSRQSLAGHSASEGSKSPSLASESDAVYLSTLREPNLPSLMLSSFKNPHRPKSVSPASQGAAEKRSQDSSNVSSPHIKAASPEMLSSCNALKKLPTSSISGKAAAEPCIPASSSKATKYKKPPGKCITPSAQINKTEESQISITSSNESPNKCSQHRPKSMSSDKRPKNMTSAKKPKLMTSENRLKNMTSETMPKNITSSKLHVKVPDSEMKPHKDFNKFQNAWMKKQDSEKTEPLFSETSHCRSGSALRGYCSVPCVDESAGREAKLSQAGLDGEKAVKTAETFCDVSDNDRNSLQNVVGVSSDCGKVVRLGTVSVPLVHKQDWGKSVVVGEVRADASSLSVAVPLETMAVTADATTPAAEAAAPPSESGSTAESGLPLPHKPHQPPSSSPIYLVNESTKLKPPAQPSPEDATFMQYSESASSQHVSPAAATQSILTFTSLPSTCATSHNTPALNQQPISSAICISTSSFSPSSPPLLSLTPPLSSPTASLAALSASPVISLAATVPSTKSEIVTYTVIGSSSVMEAGSPHTIGSPHLPESPSLAIVQS